MRTLTVLLLCTLHVFYNGHAAAKDSEANPAGESPATQGQSAAKVSQDTPATTEAKTTVDTGKPETVSSPEIPTTETGSSIGPETLKVQPGATSPAQNETDLKAKQNQRGAAELDAPPGFDAAVKLYNERNYPKAEAAFEKFISAGIANSNVHLYLGGTYQQLKKYDAALKQYDWVAQNAVLVSTKNKGKSAASTLRSYRAGVCPGQCLKLSSGGWAHYSGLNPNLLWKKFPFSGGWGAWSTNHLGEVIVYVGGKPVNKGKCPICGGTGQVPKLK